MSKMLLIFSCLFILISCTKSSDSNGGDEGLDFTPPPVTATDKDFQDYVMKFIPDSSSLSRYSFYRYDDGWHISFSSDDLHVGLNLSSSNSLSSTTEDSSFVAGGLNFKRYDWGTDESKSLPMKSKAMIAPPDTTCVAPVVVDKKEMFLKLYGYKSDEIELFTNCEVFLKAIEKKTKVASFPFSFSLDAVGQKLITYTKLSGCSFKTLSGSINEDSSETLSIEVEECDNAGDRIDFTYRPEFDEKNDSWGCCIERSDSSDYSGVFEVDLATSKESESGYDVCSVVSDYSSYKTLAGGFGKGYLQLQVYGKLRDDMLEIKDLVGIGKNMPIGATVCAPLPLL